MAEDEEIAALVAILDAAQKDAAAKGCDAVAFGRGLVAHLHVLLGRLGDKHGAAALVKAAGDMVIFKLGGGAFVQ